MSLLLVEWCENAELNSIKNDPDIYADFFVLPAGPPPPLVTDPPIPGFMSNFYGPIVLGPPMVLMIHFIA